jgi:ankyrin repeat protein
VNALLEHGADVNVTANDGGTALMLATSSGDREIVRVLLARGADVSGKFTESGKTALMLAREKGFAEIARMLEEAGAKQ